jgi:hypothetical protein
MCTEKQRREKYDANLEGEDGTPIAPIPVNKDDYKPNWRTRKVAIGRCKVIAVNLYATDKLTVEYEQDAYNAKDREMTTDKVNHKSCSKVSAPEPVA